MSVTVVMFVFILVDLIRVADVYELDHLKARCEERYLEQFWIFHLVGMVSLVSTSSSEFMK